MHFLRATGHSGKIKDEDLRYILTTFAYGTGMGPTQAAKSFTGFNDRQISFITLHKASSLCGGFYTNRSRYPDRLNERCLSSRSIHATKPRRFRLDPFFSNG